MEAHHTFTLEGTAPVLPEAIIATPEQQSLINEYARAKSMVKAYQDIADAAEALIIETFKAAGVESVTGTFGKATVWERSSYTYSSEIDALKEQLAAEKKLEELKGIAEKKTTTHFKLTPVNEQVC